MKEISLPDFLDFLNSQSARDFQGDAVDKLLTDCTLDYEQFLPFIYFREDTYGRNLVYKSDLFELLILTWLPQQRTPIHDHAGQRCWMLMELGSLSFKTYHPPSANPSALIPAGPLEDCEVGDNVYIDDGIGVHAIVNRSQKPAVSLHLYAAPVPRCRAYNEATRRFEWVDLEYFTQFGDGWQNPTAEEYPEP